jgi:hypothetical protein
MKTSVRIGSVHSVDLTALPVRSAPARCSSRRTNAVFASGELMNWARQREHVRRRMYRSASSSLRPFGP